MTSVEERHRPGVGPIPSVLYGSADNDELAGWEGDDVLWGQDGIDELDGGNGDTQMAAAPDIENLMGSDHADILAGDFRDNLLVAA